MEEQSEQNRNLTLLGAAHSLNHSLFLITPPLLSVLMTSLGVTKFEIGFASTIASMIYGAGALLGGLLGDRIGEIKAIAVCSAMSGLPAPLMLLAGSVNGLLVYAATLAFMAFWASLYHPIANSFISKAFKSRVAEAMGFHGVGGTLGIILTPTIAWFLGTSFGWPSAFVSSECSQFCWLSCLQRKPNALKMPITPIQKYLIFCDYVGYGQSWSSTPP